jgi:hypothetical protein
MIPAAQYITLWSGPCAHAQEVMKITTHTTHGTAVEPFLLTPTSLECYSQLKLTDQDIDEVIDLKDSIKRGLLTLNQDEDSSLAEMIADRGLPEGRSIMINLSGYQPAEVKVPTMGTPVNLKLKRCIRQVKFRVKPSDAKIKGPSHVTWGIPKYFQISRAGYLDVKRSVSIDRPQRCDAAPHQEWLELSRSVEVIAQTPDGLNVTPSELLIGGIPNARSQVIRPVGKYRVEAQAPDYQKLTTILTIPSCEGSSCSPVKLQLKFSPPPPPPRSTATRLRWLGGSVAIAGVSLLGFAYQGQSQYEQINYAHDLSRARERIRRVYGWGWGTLAGGLLTTGLGLIWPELSGEGASDQQRMRP